MANTILAFPNFVDADPSFAAVSVDGGSWEPHLPISNVKNRLLIRRARSTDATLSSTQFWVDLGLTRDVRVVAIPFLTASREAKYRIRGFSVKDSTTTPLADTGWKDLYPVVYPFGTLYYGHPSFFDGRMSVEDIKNFPMPALGVFEQPVTARYWLIEIDDTESELGYVEVPRIFIAPGWQPSLNFQFGAQLGYQTRTNVVESYGGAEFFDTKQGRRTAVFSFDYLDENEALVWMSDMQRKLDVSGQLFFIFDPDDVEQLHRRAFLARMTTLNPIDYAAYGLAAISFELVEVIQ